jgi:hypothetical protein
MDLNDFTAVLVQHNCLFYFAGADFKLRVKYISWVMRARLPTGDCMFIPPQSKSHPTTSSPYDPLFHSSVRIIDSTIGNYVSGFTFRTV